MDWVDCSSFLFRGTEMFFFSPAVDFTLGMFSTGIFNRSTYHLKVKDVRANCFCASLLHPY